ncbi:MAG: hypothetical protein IJS63_07265 [Bacteroidaceae bacterium]|nr:hypothetical protein [Bacteroidaceae bacterium]
MKRIYIIMCMLAGIALGAAAQDGLHINEVFEGKLIDKEEMRESLIKGESLAPYKLNVLHTIKFAANSKERASVDALFTKDMESISDDKSDSEYESEVEYVGSFIYYAIVQLTDTKKGRHRYICYQCRDNSGHYDITLAYIEGKASLADLRKTFKKK